MKDYFNLSKNQLKTILSGSSIAIYVSALDSYDLLYINDAARALLGLRDEDLKCKCYNLCNNTEPCSYCKINNMNYDSLLIREIYLEESNFGLRIEGKLIDWDGVPAHIEYIYDITASKRKEEETKLEIDKLESAFDNVSCGISVHKLEDNKIISVFHNKDFYRLMGIEEENTEKVERENTFDKVHPEDVQGFKNCIYSMFKTGESNQYIFRNYNNTKNEYIWILLQGTIKTKDNGDKHLYGVYFDVSKQIKLEKKLEAANDDMKNILNSIHGGVAIYKLCNGIEIFYISDGVPKLSGYSAEEYYYYFKNDIDNIIYHEDVNFVLEKIAQVPNSDNMVEIEYRRIHKNGSIVWVSAQMKVIGGSKDEPLIHCIFKDITLLKDTQIRLEHILNSIPGGVVVISYDNAKGFYLEFVSEGLTSLTNVPIEKMYGMCYRDMFSLVYEEDLEMVKELFKNIKHERKQQFEIVYRIKRGNEGYIWVKNNISILKNKDGVLKIYMVFIDATSQQQEKKRLNEQYSKALIQYYRTPKPNVIFAGHCNITKNTVIDMTNMGNKGFVFDRNISRNECFRLISENIIEYEEKERFLKKFNSKVVLNAFENGLTFHQMKCFAKYGEFTEGRYLCVEVHVVKMPDTGDVSGILSVTDVTSDTISERILNRLSYMNYDYVADVDFLNDNMAVLTLDENLGTVIKHQNSYMEELQHFLFDLVVPSDKDRCDKIFNKHYIMDRLKLEDSFSFSYGIKSVNGELLTKSMTISAIDLKLQRVCFAQTDITKSVREQKNLLNMIAYTFELAAIIDIDTKRLTLYTREAIINNSPPDIVENCDNKISDYIVCSGNDNDDAVNILKIDNIKRALTKKTEGFDIVLQSKTNDDICYRQINVFWGDGARKTVCLVSADVTDMLLAERKSKKYLEDALTLAKEANEAKSKFLSSMSHDIRTPMNAIIGMTDLALANIDNKMQIDESLAVIKSSSEHLLQLINDILDMSRIESGKMVLSAEVFSHNDVLKKISNRARFLAEKKGVKFTYVQNIVHDKCVGDVLRINQVIENIITNAVKFTKKGGCVTFTVEEIEQKNETLGWYIFTITDTGMGIPIENQKHIFEPFYRGDNVKFGYIEGTGLGLSIVKNILDYMGGVVQFESEVDKGTKFVIQLPLKFAENTPNENMQEVDIDYCNMDLNKMQILLVEDHPINQLVVTHILENMNAVVTVAENGKEAIEVFNSDSSPKFEAICMDIQMPTMDGYEATKAIRASNHPQAMSIPIIAMTANAFVGDVHKCLDIGMNAHISKPIDHNKLFVLLNSFKTDNY